MIGTGQGWSARACSVWSLIAAVAVASVITADLGAQSAAGAAATPLDGAFSGPQATRGEEKFKQVCAACHNIDEMSGNRFRTSWSDQTAGDLFDFLSNAMPQGDPGSLTPEEYTSIIAFFLSRSGFSAGPSDLPADKAALSKLRFPAAAK